MLFFDVRSSPHHAAQQQQQQRDTKYAANICKIHIYAITRELQKMANKNTARD